MTKTHAFTRMRALWLIPVALGIHNLEEAATIARYLPIVRSRIPPVLQSFAAQIDVASFRVALIWVTVIPFFVVAWATLRPASTGARWAALVVQAVVAVNIVSHLAIAAFVLHGYGPGLASAVFVNVPVSIYLFRRAAREHWLSPRAWPSVILTAIALHGPGLLGLLWLASRVR